MIIEKELGIREKVKEYIMNNFYLEEVTLADCPIMPGGIYLTDMNNDIILFYYDIDKDKVVWTFKK